MGWRHFAILTWVAGALELGSSAAQAYPVPVDFDGKVIRWDIGSREEPVYYETVNDSTLNAEVGESMVNASAALWSSVAGSALRLASIKDSPLSATSITVNFKSDFDGGNFAAAYAELDETDANGKPVHCSVNVAIRGNERLSDLEKTVLHELGHCLGLGHSLFPKAIMSYRLSQNSFAIDVDDAAALRRLYPEDGEEFEIPPGCAIGVARAKSRQYPGFKGIMDPTLALLPVLCPLFLRLLIVMLTGRRQRG